ncbi:TIGR04211 family SH3 domain-containing protein [Endozoicomonas sp.]|uniref:TIGR04211 family SH3 domain-containing protein n=1 Tax=Endozoicomonas sp. TaxID=1892382 RepID=UPI0028868FB8|nr:TIGR04211 family SH3 domain-containing protein [Endozoicomonas sp.]
MRYVTDITYVPMRTGPSNEYRIVHRGLKTGTALVLLEEDSGNGFSKVKTGDQEGYVPSQYLMNNPPAFRQLPAALDRTRKVEAENKELGKLLVERGSQLEEVTSELGKTEDKLNRQQVEMKRLQDISAEPLAIDRRNQQLVEDNERLKNQLQVLQAENRQLVRDTSLRWYLFGGGTILLGIILGLFLPMLKFRKKESAWV